MSKLLLICFFISALPFFSEAQDTCDAKRVFEYTDASQKTVIIRELLVYSGIEKKYVPFTCPTELFFKVQKKSPPRGVRYYNFGCIKTSKGGALFWKGQVCMDKVQHAIFSTPLMGVRGFIKLIISYTSGTRKTLYDIFDAYAPHYDCQGSYPKILVNGKWVCPPDHPNNEPEKYAAGAARALGIGVRDELKIREADGSLSVRVLTLLLSEVARVELGLKCKVEEETIRKAIALL